MNNASSIVKCKAKESKMVRGGSGGDKLTSIGTLFLNSFTFECLTHFYRRPADRCDRRLCTFDE